MITEDYVSFETAKLLKENGFDEDTYRAYVETIKEHELSFDVGRNNSQWEKINKENGVFNCSAPTLQMAMKWLREVYNVFIDISSRFSKNADKDVCFSYSCKKLIDTYKSSYEIGDGEWLNYEQACEAAIKYCLENLI